MRWRMNNVLWIGSFVILSDGTAGLSPWAESGARALIEADIGLTILDVSKTKKKLRLNIQNEKINYRHAEIHNMAEKFDPQLEKEICEEITVVKPDVIHIFGTEYAACLSAMTASVCAGFAERTVVWIQGL